MQIYRAFTDERNTINILKIRELLSVLILTFRSLGENMFIFVCVLQKFETLAKLEALSAAIF